jgi:hypothetical protein
LSNPKERKASTSSDTFIVPISAVKADPVLPAIIIPTIIGESSRVTAIPTNDAKNEPTPNRSNCIAPTYPIIIPIKNTINKHIPNEFTPTRTKLNGKSTHLTCFIFLGRVTTRFIISPINSINFAKSAIRCLLDLPNPSKKSITGCGFSFFNLPGFLEDKKSQ